MQVFDRCLNPALPAGDADLTAGRSRTRPGCPACECYQELQLRQAHPALGNRGDFQVVYAQPGRYPFAYLRQGGGERILVAVNPAGRHVEVGLPFDALTSSLENPVTLWGEKGGLKRTGTGWQIALPAASTGVYRI
jgi:hypothetical protein